MKTSMSLNSPLIPTVSNTAAMGGNILNLKYTLPSGVAIYSPKITLTTNDADQANLNEALQHKSSNSNSLPSLKYPGLELEEIGLGTYKNYLKSASMTQNLNAENTKLNKDIETEDMLGISSNEKTKVQSMDLQAGAPTKQQQIGPG